MHQKVKRELLLFVGALAICLVPSRQRSITSTRSLLLDINTSDTLTQSSDEDESMFVQTIGENKSSREIYDEEVSNECYKPCFCKKNIISCNRRDTINSLGPLRGAPSYSEIYVEEQHNFTVLRASDLAEYVNLEFLTITKSGLESIEVDAFKNSPLVKLIDLSSNRLTDVSWRFIQYVSPGLQIVLADNPLRCSCSTLFLSKYILQWPPEVEDDLNDNENYDDYDDYNYSRNYCFDGSGRHNLTDFPLSRNCAFPRAVVTENTTRTNASEVTITCKAHHHPSIPSDDLNLKVNWRKPEGRGEMEVFVEARSNSEVSMTIKKLDALSSGSYFCSAENENGFHTAQWDLLVFSSPKIKLFKKQDLYPDVALLYEIAGYPTPAVVWFKDDRRLMYDPSTELLKAEHKQLDVEPYLTRGSLQLSAPLDLTGNYTLLAANSYGAVNFTQEVLDEAGANAPLKFGKNVALTYRTPSDQKGQNESTKIIFGVLSVFLLASVAVSLYCIVSRYGPSSRRRLDEKRQTNYKARTSLLLSKGKQLKRSKQRGRLAGLCLGGSPGGRGPVCRENIPLSGDHVVQNPNYEKGDDGPRGDRGFEHGGFLDERSLPVPIIPSEDIECLRGLGEGAFGLVYLGTLRTKDPNTAEVASLTVAIKTVKDCQFENNKRDFDREATMLFGLSHENIVTLYGVSVDRQPHMIVLEYMEFGDLCNFLRTNGPDKEMLTPKTSAPVLPPRPALERPLTPLDLLAIAVQIARGASYLARQHFVHRDLATRNCLVGSDLVVKIGDFGMSRDVYATDYYKVGSHLLMPVRWMPPESIVYRTFTVESDVWSFGVVLWEIYSFGKQPWYELSNTEVIQHVQHGNMMSRPSGCPADVYGLMLRCWHRDPRERISMEKMFNRLDCILQQTLRLRKEEDPSGVADDDVQQGRRQQLQQQVPKSPRDVSVPSYLELIDG